ncbi:MAG: hypothetical protein KAJ56_04450, partial [Candidatus Aenigmarchaeota archaeon]|nr:hypothetical protein [Candidatus Aenigmarchaeota archaeon]
YILKYYASPAFKKIGMNIVIITVMQWADYSKTEELQKFIKDIKNNNSVVYFARGNGLSGRTAFFISAHKDMKSYEDFIVNIKSKWGKHISEVDQFISSIENVFKPFDCSGVASTVLKEE